MGVFLLIRATKSYKRCLLIAGKIMEIPARYAPPRRVGRNKAQRADKRMPKRGLAWSMMRLQDEWDQAEGLCVTSDG